MSHHRKPTIQFWSSIAVCALAVSGCLTYPPAPHPCVQAPGGGLTQPGGTAIAQPGTGGLQPQADPLFSGPSQPAAAGAPALRIRATAPADAAVGALMALRIEVTNVGGSPAKDVVVTHQIPASLSFVGSQPGPEDPQATTLKWRLDELPAGRSTTIDANLRVEQAGQIQQCPSATAADGVTASNCVTTNVASPSVQLRVNGPKEAVVGDNVTFEITAENSGNLPATDLKVIARFDDGLTHASGEQALLNDIDPLSPGQSRTIGITFEVTRTGTLCNEVELTGAGGLRETAQGCILAVKRGTAPVRPSTPSTPANPRPPAAVPVEPTGEPSVKVSLQGPVSAFVGGIAEFFVDVTNNGTVPLTNVNIATAFDRALVPTKADAGHTVDATGRLFWNYPSIQPGKALRLRVQCRGEEQIARACGLATVTCNEKVSDESESCVRLEMPRTELSVVVRDFNDPIDLGKEQAYEIKVTNLGPAIDRQVVVSFTVPQGMTLVPLGTMGPEGFRQFVAINPPNYRFVPLPELAPNKSEVWVVRVQADKPGDVVFKARVDSRGSEQPIDAEQKTTINPR
ncbi:MAG: hypothetical protein AB7O62_22480 [Pirellulales bacterium]